GPVASGICHVSQVPPYHSQRAPLLAHAHWAPGMPSAHTTEAGKTARRWIEEQVRSRCRAERPARLSPLLVKVPNTFEWPFPDNPLQVVVIPVACAPS
ncbi:unnamed protein product, partial [Staurois parvus]